MTSATTRSVWDFPRPPAVEAETRLVEVLFEGATIAKSSRALRVLETSHPPGIYIPLDDTQPGSLVPGDATSFCEYKGRAVYWDVVGPSRRSRNAAWSYPEPSFGYRDLAGYLSFYPGRVDACFLGGEQVTPQEGDFYGGWITSDVAGPFKGAPRTNWW